MAERRMFAKSVINSARFLRMPASSRLLYYDLGMQADDDGVVEAFAVMRTTGASEDDLRVLQSKGFIQILNEDLVTLVTDWKTNNLIRGDRYHKSIYSDLLVKFAPALETDGEPDDIPAVNHVVNQVETTGMSKTASRETEVRLGKDRLDKDIKKGAQTAKIPKGAKELWDMIALKIQKGDEVEARQLKRAIIAFCDMRQQSRKPIKTDRTASLLAGKLLTFGEGNAARMCAVLDQSTERGWTTLYPLDKPPEQQRAQSEPAQSTTWGYDAW